MEIREATPADAEAIFDVHHAAIEELGPAAYDRSHVEAWGQGGSPDGYDLESGDPYYVVADDGDAVVGFGSFAVEPGDGLDPSVDGEVTAVYVHPSAVRRGVGSRLLAELERVAREHGVETLGLQASLNAVPFYEAQGYERVAEQTHEFSGGVEGRVVEMRTAL